MGGCDDITGYREIILGFLCKKTNVLKWYFYEKCMFLWSWGLKTILYRLQEYNTSILKLIAIPME